MIVISLGTPALAYSTDISCDSFEVLYSCSYRTKGSNKVSFAKDCKPINKNEYLVKLCDNYECIAKNVKPVPQSCGNSLPNPGLTTQSSKFISSQIFSQMLQIAQDARSSEKISCIMPDKNSTAATIDPRLLARIRSHPLFIRIKDSFKEDEKNETITDSISKTEKTFFLIVPGEANKDNFLEMMYRTPNFGIKDIWVELGVTHAWVTATKTSDTRIFNLKTGVWTTPQKMYPYCE